MDQQERINQLKRLLERNPADPLALYALAMECKSLGDDSKALDCLDQLLAKDQDHVPACYQKALILLRLGRKGQAKTILQAAIPRAAGAGHLHARDKMQELLDRL